MSVESLANKIADFLARDGADPVTAVSLSVLDEYAVFDATFNGRHYEVLVQEVRNG